MRLLNIFCAECTPYLLLMLAGAWALGWLFWKLLKEGNYKDSIKKLEHELDNFKKENLNLKTEIADARYVVGKNEKEMLTLRSKIGDLDLQDKVKGEKISMMQETYDKLKDAYDRMKS